MKILLVSDIHGNFPALKAVTDAFDEPFDLVLNSGDSTVYAPFPNQTIDWLRGKGVPSILGNTDEHVNRLLNGKTFSKPGKAEKRIMYGATAAELSAANRTWLTDLPQSRAFTLDAPFAGSAGVLSLGMFHGSPADPDEFLFPDTPLARFRELADSTEHDLIIIGHSHTPFHKLVDGIHFINPGSVGRMFDGSPQASCAVVEWENGTITVNHCRIAYPVDEVIAELARLRFPPIYQEMYRQGRKLN